MKTLKITTDALHPGVKIEDTVTDYRCSAIQDAVQEQKLTISYSLELIEKEVLLRGQITGEITTECCRCLDSYTYPVSLTMTQSFPATVQEIDIEDEVRQMLILNLPAKPLCRTDCQGICVTCGKNKNKQPCTCAEKPEDPRWEKLKTIINKK